jgi:dihydrofolate reductase
MPKTKAQIAVSLDGYMAGPNQSEENPLGEGAGGLHEWIFKLASFRSGHGMGDDGETGVSDDVLRAAQENIGAVVMGRNMFGPVRGGWPDEDWKGWWGDDPPFGVSVFVLTHHPRESLEMKGGTTFQFVTEGPDAALEGALAAAGEKDVLVAGGAEAIQGCLATGRVEEIQIHVTPVLLGGGARLFEGFGPDLELEQMRAIESSAVTHLKYRVSK